MDAHEITIGAENLTTLSQSFLTEATASLAEQNQTGLNLQEIGAGLFADIDPELDTAGIASTLYTEE